MSERLQQILQITFVLVALYLVLWNAKAFAGIVGSLSSAYTGGVKALQGRGT